MLISSAEQVLINQTVQDKDIRDSINNNTAVLFVNKCEEIKMYLPLKLLNNYTEKSDISWQELDLINRMYRKKYHLPDESYITKTEVWFAIICKENTQLKSKLDILQASFDA